MSNQFDLPFKKRTDEYEQYLASQAWAAIRKWVRWRSGGVCEVPTCMNQLEATHHCIASTGEPDYRNLFCEGPYDVLGVCDYHHELFHKGWRIEGQCVVPFAAAYSEIIIPQHVVEMIARPAVTGRIVRHVGV